MRFTKDIVNHKNTERFEIKEEENVHGANANPKKAGIIAFTPETKVYEQPYFQETDWAQKQIQRGAWPHTRV